MRESIILMISNAIVPRICALMHIKLKYNIKTILLNSSHKAIELLVFLTCSIFSSVFEVYKNK